MVLLPRNKVCFDSRNPTIKLQINKSGTIFAPVFKINGDGGSDKG